MTEEIEIKNHILVPKHSILSKEEKEALLKKYNISEKQLPQISIKDPAIKNLNPQVEDVIKIIRESETESQSIFFRIVKED